MSSTTATHPALINRSIAVIRAGQAPSGAYLASPTFPHYRFCWFRDGSFIADAMSRAGDPASAEAFYRWCSAILTDRAERIAELVARVAADPASVGSSEQLHTRYTADGRESGEPWQDFQLDGYGMWLWSLGEHSARYGMGREQFRPAVELTVDYLVAFWDSPCYDWWEENGDGRHPSTLSAVRAGLLAAAGWPEVDPGRRERATASAGRIVELVAAQGMHDGRLTKSLGNSAVDGSLIACLTPFGLHPPEHPVARRTVAEVTRQLAPAGVYRYLSDTYYGGGEWILLAGLLGWHHAVAGDRPRARQLLDWMLAQADGDLRLPEQVATRALHPDRIGEWERRWGPSASPLLWSHAMYLTLASELGLVSPAGGGSRPVAVQQAVGS